MKLSIIIPAHNEQATIEQVLKKVADVKIEKWEKEIIVVDDGSSDGTKAVVENWLTKQRVPLAAKGALCFLINHPKNFGKGAAIKSALEKVRGDYVIIQDADLEYNPSDIPKMLSALNNLSPALSRLGERDYNQVAIFGDRGTKSYPERGFHYVVGAKLLTWAVNVLYGVWLRDSYTGYKLIPTAIMKTLHLESTGFEFEAEVTCKLLKKGIKIEEVSIRYQPRNKEQGKHIRFSDAVRGSWVIIKSRVK